MRYCHSDITSTRFQGNIATEHSLFVLLLILLQGLETKSGIEIPGTASCTIGRPAALLGVQLLLGNSLTVDRGLQVLLVLVF